MREGERVAKEPDAMQVAAHALLLREHGVNAVRGAIYYAADKRRVPVDFSEELFGKVRNADCRGKSRCRQRTLPAAVEK